MKEQEVHIYKTNAALGKAKAKVSMSLPDDNFRAKEVLESHLQLVTKKIGIECTVSVVPDTVNNRGTSEGVKNLVRQFYYRQVKIL